MKLVTFTFNGTTSIGAINGDHIVDFSNSSLPHNMIDFIALGEQGLDTAKNLIDNNENKIELSKVHLESPITKPSKILAVGLNYKEHKDEVDKLDTGRAFARGAAQEESKTIHKSAITDHVMQLNHVMDWEGAKIIDKEPDWKVRGIKEAINIRRTKENMNRDQGRYNLSHLYNDFLCPLETE